MYDEEWELAIDAVPRLFSLCGFLHFDWLLLKGATLKPLVEEARRMIP